MTKLIWSTDTKLSTGLSHGVIYFDGGYRAWQGLTEASAEPPAATSTQYLDGEPHVVGLRGGEYEGSLSAYTYPEVLDNQTATARQLTGMTYRTDTHLYLIYNPFVYLEPSPHQTDADTVTASDFSFSITTKPTLIDGLEPISQLIVSLDQVNPAALADLETMLYGGEDSDPIWPTIEQVVELVEARAVLRITDHRDGTWTADGPASAIKMVSATEFEITWPSAIPIDADTFIISSL